MVPVLYHINLNAFSPYMSRKLKSLCIWDAELAFSTGLKSGGTPGGTLISLINVEVGINVEGVQKLPNH